MSVNIDYRKIIDAENIIIYGTGVMANAFYQVMKSRISIRCFMVTCTPEINTMYDEYPVISVVDTPEHFKNDLVVVAVVEKYVSSILHALHESGFENIMPVSFESLLWQHIRTPYICDLMERMGLHYCSLAEKIQKPSGSEKNACDVYQVKCHLDANIKENNERYGYEIPIQAGAALTDQKVANVLDNQGDNISERNKQYCELTAWYWVWKNVVADYVGICHYRRHFMVGKEMLEQLNANDIDAILTVPILNFPSVKEMYEHDHLLSDWEVMMEAIEKLQPEYLDAARKIESGKLYFAYNMIIARQKVYAAYCEWLFPILTYCEKNCRSKVDRYQERYIGFLAERLLTIYFWKNWDTLNVVFAEKEYLTND